MSNNVQTTAAIRMLTADAARGVSHLELIEKRLQEDAAYVARTKERYAEELAKESPDFDRLAGLLEEMQHHFTSNVLPNLRLDNVCRAAGSVRSLALLTSITKEA